MRSIAILLSTSLMTLVSLVAWGAAWHVAPPPLGNDTNPGTEELPFATIQHGIDASSDSDTVIVAQGTYLENIQVKGKNITLTSADPLDSTVVANTVIDGNQAGSVVTLSGTETEACILSGFTIRNGKADFGGGIAGNGTRAAIQNNTITRNSALRGGGAEECDGTIENNAIVDNSVDYHGGGLSFCDGTIQNNTITGNSANQDGGGLFQCGGTIQSNTIRDNSATWGGGLRYCNGTIQNNTIMRNSATGSGGGLDNCSGTIRNNTIADNSADMGGGLDDCGPMTKPYAVVQNNTITGNSAAEHGGGLLWCHGTILNNRITGNSAGTYGAGLHSCGDTIDNNTIASNVAGQYGGGLALSFGVHNCVIWGNNAPNGPQVYESGTPTYSCIEGWGGGGNGNVASDPRFVRPYAGDYRLQEGSPCIDAGFNSQGLPPFDITGMDRIMYGGKSLTVDMGAYEYYVNALSRELGGNAILTWSSVAGKSYRVERSSDMFTWEIAAKNVPSLGDTVTTWTDTSAPFTSPAVRIRFYRTVHR